MSSQRDTTADPEYVYGALLKGCRFKIDTEPQSHCFLHTTCFHYFYFFVVFTALWEGTSKDLAVNFSQCLE